MIESTRPRLNRVKYAAMLLGAVAVAAFPPAGLSAVASAERVWDLDKYQECWDAAWAKYPNPVGDELADALEACCWGTGGIYKDGHCFAPPAEAVSGSRQFPGNAHIPSDIATAPLLTPAPRPIHVPSDIATAPAASNSNELGS